MSTFLEFEKPVADLTAKIIELKAVAEGADDGEPAVNIDKQVEELESKIDDLLKSTYEKLSPWQKAQVARHQDRPHFQELSAQLFNEYVPLSGDRSFADDTAILGGIACFREQSVIVIGHEKGRDTEGRIHHNFGMSRPEGYRKAMRLMRLAEQFNLPVLTFIDTPGAYPGVGAEERGQAEAIARSTELCLELSVPIIATIVGEGGSGGAVALAAGNRVLMLEHAIYSVISPEGCASILWRTAEKAKDAASALKITAQDLIELGIIDKIVEEPLGGAHRDPSLAIKRLGDEIFDELTGLIRMPPAELKHQRNERFLAIGAAFQQAS
ncbi:MAG: acetyl-CoA carboxylase carboxyltransferase subunit alpha [Pseudomonadota bacterium]